MAVIGMIRGREVLWDGEIFRWTDTLEPAVGWGGEERPCPACDLTANKDGIDPCLGVIPNCKSACCGHGTSESYIILDD